MSRELPKVLQVAVDATARLVDHGQPPGIIHLGDKGLDDQADLFDVSAAFIEDVAIDADDMVELGGSEMRILLNRGQVLLFFPDQLGMPSVRIRVAVLL